MSTEIAQALVAPAVRLPEVETAVLDVLDDRGVKVGQSVSFFEIEVAMDARGYPIKWVRRAVNSLATKGVLNAGLSTLTRLNLPDVARRKKRERQPAGRKRRRPVL